jgi:L-fucose isomerase-like protein
MSQHFGITPIHPGTLLGEGEVEAIIGDYLRALEELGGERWAVDAIRDDQAQLFLLVATGGTEEVILRVCEERHKSSPDEALFLIAHPGNNSLPAALEVLARQHQDGAHGRIFYLDGPDDAAGLGEIADAVQDVTVRRAMQRARIGLVGTPSDWLVASMPNASTIQAAWGPTVVPIEMEEVVEKIEAVDDSSLEPHVEAFVADPT